MKKASQEIYDNLTNAELVEVAANCLEAIQQRYDLLDCLTEQTYNPEEDIYDYDYSCNPFDAFIEDFKKYLKSNEYKIAENKEKKW